MPAAATDYFQKTGMSTATTLSSPGYTIGDTSINVASTTNWPTTTGVTFAIDTVDSSGERVAGSYNVFRGTVDSATQITNLTYVGGDANQNYSAGATTRVYITVSSYHNNRMVDGLLIEHEQDGTHAVELITSRTEDTSPDLDSDFLLSYDTSAAALKKVKPSSLFSAGWSDTEDVPDTVTYNGNRSYDLVFNTNDLTDTLSNGMRLKLTRTVTAPTQCADLEASSSQYFSRTSAGLTGITFTDDFVVSAWVKLESYVSAGIVGRYNGTSGWLLYTESDGRLVLSGYNAGGANFSKVTSYQSLPLNKWIHISAQLDMSTFTATTTTSYIMIDGVNVPAVVARGGTNPTALVQAGDLNIGAYNGGTGPFDGKIAQVAIYSAKVTQANIVATISQGLSGSETSLAAAYSFNNDITDLTANNNDLTANGGALATATDSPFSGGSVGTTEYGIITANTFSTNTTLTVQVPEGYAIPTSGGVSAVAYSTQDVPYGFERRKGKWRLSTLLRTTSATTSNATYGAFLAGGFALTVPIGAFKIGYVIGMYSASTTAVYMQPSPTALTGGAVTAGDIRLTSRVQASSAATTINTATTSVDEYLAAAATYVFYTYGATTAAGLNGAETNCELYADIDYV